ncbi:SDR family NAD(P)-dependent oxidoreductase [Siculibacillus lacustris]|uniref:SDR family NAD(P)-dependent oxidoreductase n=1 Tax=Siculibacillus lacustris TaxID=1549641 RepID=A0A4Q9VWR7_9HYPH|nr:SDR family NAD(P)-dependent oxidoreductase [Siculibacillus lacustris]TBW39545.1 SDR family NAD(P)-dependent oxidoreductase [Siculibacillus lacustris]
MQASQQGTERRPVALISGGSSGIGLACAEILVRRGYAVVVAARDPDRLAAAARLGAIEGAAVTTRRLDVTDAAACAETVAEVVASHGGLDWLLTSAGIVEPGMFLDGDPAGPRREMETNYFGTLNLVRPAAVAMAASGGGRITMIASAAAFIGILGYSGYGASKFAVRGLGECLRVELAPKGISVSVAFPPDTDTPQLAGEALTRPEATRLIAEGTGVWAAKTVAERLIAGAEAGRFMLVPSRQLALLGALASLIAPGFRWHQGRIAAKFSARR